MALFSFIHHGVIFFLVTLVQSSSESNVAMPSHDLQRDKVPFKPAMQVVVTSKGMDYLTHIWVPIVRQELAKLQGKHISGHVSQSGFNFDFDVSNIEMHRLDFGKLSVSSHPESGVTVSLNKSSLSASADIQFGGLGTTPDNISLMASVEGVRSSLGVSVSNDDREHPRIVLTSCHFEVEDFNATATGDTAPFFNVLINDFKEKYKDTLGEFMNKTVCDQLEDLLKTLDKSLADKPVVIELGDHTSGLDLSLADQPIFTEHCIVTSHKGEFVSTSQPNIAPPFTPTPLPLIPPSWTASGGDKMAYVQVSEYLVNTASIVYMRAGKLRKDITSESIHDNGPFLRLDTTTFSLIIPQMFHRFGAKDLVVTIRANKIPPSVAFTENGAEVSLCAALDVYVVCNDSNSSSPRHRGPVDSVCEHDLPLALTLGVNASISAQVWLYRNSSEHNNSLYIMANASSMSIKLYHISSNVGDFDVEKINKVATGLKLIQTKALPSINDWVNKGFAIPDLGIDGLTLMNPELKFHKGYVTLMTDIAYEV